LKLFSLSLTSLKIPHTQKREKNIRIYLSPLT
jgi:hypothetical protein